MVCSISNACCGRFVCIKLSLLTHTPSPPEGYFCHSTHHVDRQQRRFNIFVDLLFSISSKILRPTGLKRKERKEQKVVFLHSFADLLCLPNFGM